jgi:hypothetical protein
MKNKQLVSEIKRFQEIAGIRKEANSARHGGVYNIPDFEFELDGKAYIANLDVNYSFDWDTEDGAYDYEQEIEVKELGMGDISDYEYTPVTDQSIVLDIRQRLNTDPKLSKEVENQVDTWDAETEVEDYYDDGDYDDFREGDDYNPGTPSGDTAVMGNIN